jgi:hypothetical protein
MCPLRGWQSPRPQEHQAYQHLQHSSLECLRLQQVLLTCAVCDAVVVAGSAGCRLRLGLHLPPQHPLQAWLLLALTAEIARRHHRQWQAWQLMRVLALPLQASAATAAGA